MKSENVPFATGSRLDYGTVALAYLAKRVNNSPASLFSPESCLLMLHPVFQFFHFENRNVTTKRKPHSGPPSGFSV